MGAAQVGGPSAWPSAQSAVTVLKDAAGQYFASFAVETSPAADAARLPAAAGDVGIDLGLTAFAVLPDGTVIRSPKFLRRAGRKLRRAQRALTRPQKGSRNREQSRARQAAADAR